MNRLQPWAFLAVCVAGAAAACLSWNGFVVLASAWALTGAGLYYMKECLSRFMLALTTALSLWLALIALLPPLPVVALAAVAGTLIAAGSLKRMPPPANAAGLWGGALIVFGLLIHSFINSSLGKPFDAGAWTRAALAAASLPLGFALSAGIELSVLRRIGAVAAPLGLAAVAMAHGLQYRALQSDLESAQEPALVAERAFSRGYAGLGIEAAWREIKRLTALGRFDQATIYMRGQWRHTDRTRFLDWLEDNPGGAISPWQIAVCFGAQLRLNEGEEALGFQFDPGGRVMRVLTSQGRMIELGDTLNIADSPDPERIALANRLMLNQLKPVVDWYVSDGNMIEWMPQNRSAVRDLHFSEPGASFFLLYGTGRIDRVSYDESAGGFVQRERFPALWKDADTAIAFIRDEENDGFFILTRYGGLHYHNREFFNREFSPFWDPARPAMQDMAWDRERSQMLLMDDYGRIDFVDLAHEPTPEAPAASARASISAAIRFDRDDAIWRGAPVYRDIALVSEHNTILLLHQNGFIEAVALQQGARIRYRRGEWSFDLREAGG